ncbi:MAG: HD domain-containing protein [Planctomycetes bacterium]|nr:HD domain-containing protein [Planctomycetota bacterium]
MNLVDAHREALTARMRAFFNDDPRFVEHALEVLANAEAIRILEGGDATTVTAAALLHDVGIPTAERKYGSAAGKYQELEGPPLARVIMKDAGLDAATIDHVCNIIADHHSGKRMDSLEFRVLWDADQIVNIPNERPDEAPASRRRYIEKVFRTKAGRAIALDALA